MFFSSTDSSPCPVSLGQSEKRWLTEIQGSAKEDFGCWALSGLQSGSRGTRWTQEGTRALKQSPEPLPALLMVRLSCPS